MNMEDSASLTSLTNNNLVYLQVKGKNKLVKEIEETHKIIDKVIVNDALHRNEVTKSVEGHY